MYLATLTSPDHTAELSALCTLIYQDRLNDVPLDQSDPRAAIDEVCQRFGDTPGPPARTRSPRSPWPAASTT